MKRFQYFRPQSLSQVLSLLERFGEDARPFLGGTDLLVRIQKLHMDVDAVVDLKRVEEIGDTVEVSFDSIVVGARVVLADLVAHEQIQKHYPALVQAASIVGSIQIRNRATLAGNICNASPSADTVPPLMAYRASVTLAGPAGSRQVRLEDFFLGPGKTVRTPVELVVAVHIPIPRPPFGSAFGRISRRRGVDLSTINVACSIDDRGITTLVFGAAGPTPILTRDETGELADADLAESRREHLLRSLIEATNPISDVRSGVEYRRAMLSAVGRRVLRQAQARRQAQAG